MLQESVFHSVLELVPHFQVLVYTKARGVILPAHLMAEEVCLLDLGFGLARPPVVSVGVHDWTAQLSFGGVNQQVKIPWGAVAAIKSPEFQFAFKVLVEEKGPFPPAPTEPPRPALRRVK